MSEAINRSLNVYINSGQAQQTLDALLAKQKKLTDEIGTATPAQAKKLQVALDQLQEPINRATKKVTGELSPSFKDLQQTVNALGNRLKQMSSQDADYSKIVAQYKDANTLLDAQRSKLKVIQAAHEDLGTSFGRIFERVAEFVGAYAIIETLVGGIKSFFTSSIEEADKAADATVKLQTALENVNRLDLFAGFSEQAEKFAAAYKRINPNDIKEIFAKLVDYGKLSETQITALTDVIINFAAREKVSLADATNSFTQAFEGRGPILKRYGINLTDVHSVTERFNIVMTQMTEKVKGSEVAFEQTAKGSREVWGEAFVRLKESVGEFIESLAGLEEQQQRTAVAAKADADQGNILVARYEELSGKVNKTTAEKEELKTITNQLVGIFGTSVVEIDKETGALNLNVDATKDLIKQKLLLANQQASTLALKFSVATDKEKKSADDYTKTLAAVQQKEKDLGVTLDQVNKKQADFGNNLVGGNIELTEGEKRLFNMGVQLRQLTRDQKNAGDEAKTLQASLEELGFTATDVDKLLHPKTTDPNKPINPNADDPNKNKEADRKLEELKAKAEEFNKKIRELQQQSQDANLSQNAKEVADAKHKYDEIFIAYDELVKKLRQHPSLLQFTEEDLKNLENNELAGIAKKQAEKAAKDQQEIIAQEYKEALEQSALYFENLKAQRAEDFTKGKIDEKKYKEDIAIIETAATANQLQIAEDYSGKKIIINGKEVALVKQADEDVTKFKKLNLDKQVADQLATFAKQEANRKLFEAFEKQASLSHAQALVSLAPSGTNEQLHAQQNLLKAQHDETVKDLKEKSKEALKSFKEDSVEYKRINDETNQAIKDADAKFGKDLNDLNNHFLENKVSFWANKALDTFNMISDLMSNQENSELAHDKAVNDKKKKNLDDRLKKGLISQGQYDKEVQKLQADQDKKQHEVEVKQFKRKQKASIAQTIINAAEGAIKLWDDPGFPGNIPLLIVLAAQTALQVGAITAQKPPELARGGFLRGRSHARGGLAVVDNFGNKQAEVEGGEAVVNKTTMADGRVFTATGTPSQIISSLNGMYGFSWQPGAKLVPAWYSQPYQGMNFNTITSSINTVRRSFASGGILDTNSSVSQQQSTAQISNALDNVAATNATMAMVLASIQKSGIKAFTIFTENEDVQSRVASIRDQATFKPKG